MKFNSGSAAEKYSVIANLFGEETGGLSPKQIYPKTITRLKNFIWGNTSFLKMKKILISAEMIKKLAEDTMNIMGFSVKVNPKPANLEQIEAIYKEALL
jgi:alcohol dehydrogenase class IV